MHGLYAKHLTQCFSHHFNMASLYHILISQNYKPRASSCGCLAHSAQMQSHGLQAWTWLMGIFAPWPFDIAEIFSNNLHLRPWNIFTT